MMMTRTYIAALLLMLSLTARADEHTQLVGLSLGLPPEQLMEQLEAKGLQREDRYELSGTIAGLDAWVTLSVSRDSAAVNHILLTTQEQQGNTLSNDYAAIRRWMQKHYGAPTWEGTVRSHPFARWFVGLDRDIVLIATATAGIEVWFYDNHRYRNIDYYSILKYCERNPASGIPFMTAQQQVTWKSTGDTSTVKKRTARHHVRKATKNKRRSKARKSRKRRRRR